MRFRWARIPGTSYLAVDTLSGVDSVYVNYSDWYGEPMESKKRKPPWQRSP